MAERRMFARQIIDSDAFLDMPSSTQALYFHLGMRADDEGFINNHKKIQRMINAADDDMRILISKNFVIPFETGVCVIKHWKIHNYIRGDRLQDTVYQDERNKLSIKNNNVYSMTDKCLTDVSQMSAEVSIGKVRVGKVSKELIYDDHPEFIEFWNAYPNKSSKHKSLQSWVENKPPIKDILNALTWQKELQGWQDKSGAFIPMAVTYLNQKRWQDEPPMKQERKFSL